MSTGTWLNQDGLYLQFGTQKAVPEVGGEYLVYGDIREVETYICLAATQWGPPTAGTGLAVPALPSSFVGTGTAIQAGVQSLTTLFPLQQTAPVTASAGTTGVQVLAAPQLFIDSIELECLISAAAGTGGATGLTGIGLVTVNPTTQAFVQVTPNAGTQLFGAITNAKMVAGAKWYMDPDGTFFGSATPPVAGSWFTTTTPNGLNVPLVTNSITPLPTNAYISAIAAGGTYSGSGATGLLRMRVKYGYFGNISY